MKAKRVIMMNVSANAILFMAAPLGISSADI
jgi:hypothetical protein